MKRHHIFLGIVMATLFGSMMVAGPVLAKQTLTPEEARSIAEEAYIFSYPMMENYKTYYFRIVAGKGALNAFLHRLNSWDRNLQPLSHPTMTPSIPLPGWICDPNPL